MPYKNIQTIQVPFSTEMSFYVDSKLAIDRLRISLGGYLVLTDKTEAGVLLWSDLINSNIGTLGLCIPQNGMGFYAYQETIKPSEGLEVFFREKVHIQGNYQLIPSSLDGSAVTSSINSGVSDIYVNIEYWID